MANIVAGDLWDGNVAARASDDLPYIFDASAFWAHNEYDMKSWRAARFKLKKPFIKEYFQHIPISPPVDDWDDRNLLYSLRADLHDSILFPSTPRFRTLILHTVKELIAKFPKGYEGSFPCKGTETKGPIPQVVDVDGHLTENPSFASDHKHVQGVEEYNRTLDQHLQANKNSANGGDPLSLSVEGGGYNGVSDNGGGAVNSVPLQQDAFDGKPGRDQQPEIAAKPEDQSSNELDLTGLRLVEVGSEIGVGESAISPPTGSIVGESATGHP